VTPTWARPKVLKRADVVRLDAPIAPLASLPIAIEGARRAETALDWEEVEA